MYTINNNINEVELQVILAAIFADLIEDQEQTEDMIEHLAKNFEVCHD